MIKTPLTLEHALLGFLHEKPMHAYEMHQRLEQAEALGLVWRLKQSQLYALLTRLEESGYLAGTVEPQGNRPPRRVLHLTEEGQRAFTRWMREPVSHGRDFRQEFLAKLFFAQQDGPSTVKRLVDDQQRACQQWLADLRHTATTTNDRPYEWLVLQFRIGTIEAIVAWLATCAATLLPDRPT